MNISEIFIKDGNFKSWLRGAFLVVGICIVYVSLKYFDSILLMSFGLLIAALGGYSSKAHTIGLKPFDNTYEKTKESYKKEDKNK
jgi:hypothetical protein